MIIKAKIISTIGTVALVSIVYFGFAFKNAENPGTKLIKKSASVKPFANPQWFTYNLDPTAANFATQKLVAANYTATGITNQSTRPCSSSSTFCSIYAETVSGQPNLGSTQPIYTALSAYSNGDGDQTLIDEKN